MGETEGGIEGRDGMGDLDPYARRQEALEAEREQEQSAPQPEQTATK